MDFYFYISLVLYVSLLAPLNHVTATAPDTLKLVHMVIVLFLICFLHFCRCTFTDFIVDSCIVMEIEHQPKHIQMTLTKMLVAGLFHGGNLQM